MTDQTPSLNLDSLIGSLCGGGALKKLIYGPAGSGKSTNLVSLLVPYLAEGYSVIWIVTEDNALAGIRDGFKIYSKLLQPFLQPKKLFLADLRKKIAAYNQAYAGNVKDPSLTALAPGGPLALFSFLIEDPKVVDFLEPNKAPANFRGLTNLTTLTPGDKVLLIVDGLTRIDANTAGFAFKARKLKELEGTSYAIAMLQKGGISALQEVLGSLTTDVICLGHDALQGVDLTSMIREPDAKKEAQEKRDLQEQQMQNATGFPAVATSSTRSSFLGYFGFVTHAEDTRLADSKVRARFIYNYSMALDTTTWYTRVNLSFSDSAKKFAASKNCLPFVPQNWTSSLHLDYLFAMQRLSEENLDKILKLTNQARL